MSKKDLEMMSMILSERYDNDLNPDIETTKYQDYTEREDDDGVDWGGDDRVRRLFLRKFKNDDVELSEYIWGDKSYDKLNSVSEDDWVDFFSYAFDIPVEKFEEVDNMLRNFRGGYEDIHRISIAAFKKAGLDGRLLMSDEKREELLR